MEFGKSFFTTYSHRLVRFAASRNASFSYFNLGIFKAFCDIHLQYQILNTIPVFALNIYTQGDKQATKMYVIRMLFLIKFQLLFR